MRLVLLQQQLAGLLNSTLQAGSDQSEHTGQIDFHRDRVVENGDDAGNSLPHGADTEDEAVAFPAFAAGAGASRQDVDDLRETLFDTATRLRSVELVGDADGDNHVPWLARLERARAVPRIRAGKELTLSHGQHASTASDAKLAPRWPQLRRVAARAGAQDIAFETRVDFTHARLAHQRGAHEWALLCDVQLEFVQPRTAAPAAGEAQGGCFVGG
jgi:hypothetical protein